MGAVVEVASDRFFLKPALLELGQIAGTLADESESKTFSAAEFRDLKDRMARFGLELGAIENFAVRHWSDILLDGPRKQAQMAALKQMVRDVAASPSTRMSALPSMWK